MFLKKSKIIQAILIFTVILLQIPINSSAQNYNENNEVRQMMEKIIVKKMRVDTSRIHDFEEDMDFVYLRKNNQSRAAGDETQISNHAYAESEVHAVINPADSNNIVLSPIRLKPGEGFTLPIYYTRDFGTTWHQSSFVPRPRDTESIVLGGGDPVFAFDADGKLYFTWIVLYRLGQNFWWELLWAYSEDGGETWSKSVNDYIVSSSGLHFTSIPVIADKHWVATDKTDGLYRNNLYIAFLYADMSANKTHIAFHRKRDSVDAFDAGINISGASFREVQFACVGVNPYGYIHVTFYGSKDKVNYYLWHSISKDGGNTFSEPSPISKLQKLTKVFGINDSRLYPAPYIDIDLSKTDTRGNIYMTWTSTGIDRDEGNGADIFLSVSSDTGVTWSTPIIVNNDPRGKHRDQFYSSIYVNPDGVVSLAWYDARHSKDSLNEIVHLTLAHSFDGGKTFTENFNVTSQFSNFQTIGLRNNNFGIGEYNQLVATSGYVIPVWSDGRKGDGNLDIYIAFAEISRNPVSITEFNTLGLELQIRNIYPVPARKEVTIDFYLEQSTFVSFKIYSADGKEIVKLQNQKMEKGNHNVSFNVSRFNTGMYILQMTTDSAYITRKFSVNRSGK